MIALDHDNKNPSGRGLEFPVFASGRDEFDDPAETEVQRFPASGRCVERGMRFIFDQGSLAAFDRATGNSRWRLPSVGISGLWFDERE